MRIAILGVSLLTLAVSSALVAQEEAAVTRTPALPAMLMGHGGHVAIPMSSIQRPEDRGLRAHTHLKILVAPGRPEGAVGFPDEEATSDATPVAGYYAETPASLACLYGMATVTTGCNPMSLSTNATGGSKAIAIVDAYDYPTALNDLKAYSSQFSLPAPTGSTFTVAYQGTTAPPTDPSCGSGQGWNCWEAEAALDIEMAHAISPSAHIYLVEANSNKFSDLFAAVAKAVTLVKAAGGGEVSMSWGGSEFSNEAASDSTFLGTNVTFFASTGDSEGTQYPSVSPNVVAVGGTTLERNPNTLAFLKEISWEDSGGGYSQYESRPTYQSNISTIVGTHRGVPDVSAIGNPRTGVWVYDSYDNTVNGTLYPWNIFGGTSVAAPLWASIVNHSGHFSASSSAELTTIYTDVKGSTGSKDYFDVNDGSCGYYEGWNAIAGWDPCTGWGAPRNTTGK